MENLRYKFRDKGNVRMKKIKILGQVFTPDWIVEEILDSVGFVSQNDNILSKKIIDPACGDGAFLKIIVQRIIDKSLKQNKKVHEIKNILENNIYGIEIDTKEFKNCINNLNDVVEKKLNQKIKIDWEISNENTLYKYKEYLGFFDFVVGNPPYIRIHNLDEETRKILKKEFLFSQGTIDIYVSFFELGFKLLNKKGILGYITPNSYLHNSSYKSFRKYLKEAKAVRSLTNFKSNKIFNNVSTYTAITIINFYDFKNEFIYKELVDKEIIEVNKINYVVLNDNDWSFSNTEEMNFLKKIFSVGYKKVSDFFDVQYGIATLRDNIFIGEIEKEKDSLVLFNKHWVEKNILYKVIKGSTYKGNDEEVKYIIFPYKKDNEKFKVIQEQELEVKYPKCYDYLLENKKELLKRDIDKCSLWYEFGRSQGLQTIHNEKIVISTLMKDSIKFYDLDDKTFVYSGIFIIKKKKKSNWEIIKNILNSNEFLKYIKITGKDFSGGYKSITSNQIKNFPTKELDIQTELFNL